MEKAVGSGRDDSGTCLNIRLYGLNSVRQIKRQLPQKLSSADEKTWAAEPVWVSSGEAGVLTKESQAFESEFEPESEKESESEQGTAEMTEKESESPTESTTADSFVIPLPPQVG